MSTVLYHKTVNVFLSTYHCLSYIGQNVFSLRQKGILMDKRLPHPQIYSIWVGGSHVYIVIRAICAAHGDI
jgi:hypothetical protein